MPYASIDISPVGEPEHPLVGVLYDTIFSDCPANERPALAFPPDEKGVLVMAHLEGNPLGFGLAELLTPDCYIRLVAVLKDYRRQGVGGRIVASLAGHARSRGCTRFIIPHADHPQIAPLAASLGFRRVSDQFEKTLA